MSILEGLRLAVNGLLSNRLRSALTMLGILIGVSAVILLVGVGNGASVAVQQQIQSLGSNLLTVFPSNARSAGGVQQGFGTGSTLTLDDVKATRMFARQLPPTYAPYLADVFVPVYFATVPLSR